MVISEKGHTPRRQFMKALGTLLIMLGTASFAFAGGSVVPEVDGNTAASAVALISGGLLVLRGRRKKS